MIKVLGQSIFHKDTISHRPYASWAIISVIRRDYTHFLDQYNTEHVPRPLYGILTSTRRNM